VQPLGQDILQAVHLHKLENRPLRATDGLVVSTDDERRHFQQLVARYRNLPEDQRRRAPALLHSVAELEFLLCDFEAAQRDFHTSATLVQEPGVQLEVHADLFMVALERRQHTEALEAFKRATAREPERFGLFPLTKYEPEAIVRNDAFGIVFLCKHRT